MSDQALRSKLIRLAHEKPELRPHLLPLLSKEHKTAGYSASATDIVWTLFDQQKYAKLKQKLLKEDPMSAKLLSDIMAWFLQKFDLQGLEEGGFNRLRGLFDQGERWQTDLLRNNVFKIANSLGIKLPSHNF